MFRLIRYSFIYLLLVYLFTASAGHADEKSIGKLPGAKILHGSCDPNADPAQDGTHANAYEDSCANTSPSPTGFDEFKVTIQLQPANPSYSYPGYTSANTLFGAVFPEVFASNITGNSTLDVTAAGVSSGDLLLSFELRYEGGQACVYVHGQDPDRLWRVSNHFPQDLNDVYDLPSSLPPSDPLYQPLPPMPPTQQPTIRASNAIASNGDNCVPSPPEFYTSAPLVWNSLSVSPVCTNYDSSSSNFRWPPDSTHPNGKNRAFLGIVVECIEDTLQGLFYPTAVIPDANGKTPPAQDTFFSAMQKRLSVIIGAILTIYIIFIGFRLVIDRAAPTKSEWIWFALRACLVMYFAASSGMVDLFPNMLNVSKGISSILMDAGYNTQDPNEGYNYCNFGNPAYAYPVGKENMRLWDTIDCKLSKYLGVGDNGFYRDAPQVLFVGVLAIVGSKLGIPIFCLSFIFLSILIMVTVRVVHIYIVAFTALVLLIFISPIVIPAVFFQNTKSYFELWLSQLIAFWLQPMILFGFLSFMFAIIDQSMFGGNHAFESVVGKAPAMKIVNDNGVVAGNLIKNGSSKNNGGNVACGGGDAKCVDTSAAAYQYQAITFKDNPWPSKDFSFFNVWHIGFPDQMDEYMLMVSICKLILITFIAYCLLDSVENIAARFVGGMSGSGASAYSASPVASPQSLLTMEWQAALAGANIAMSPVRNAKKIARGTAEATKSVAKGLANITVVPAVAMWAGNKYQENRQGKVADKAKEAQEQMIRMSRISISPPAPPPPGGSPSSGGAAAGSEVSRQGVAKWTEDGAGGWKKSIQDSSPVPPVNPSGGSGGAGSGGSIARSGIKPPNET